MQSEPRANLNAILSAYFVKCIIPFGFDSSSARRDFQHSDFWFPQHFCPLPSPRVHSSPGMTDSELLHAYAQTRSEEAFAVLIDRYIRLVYSACQRQLTDRHLAEDATQGVFVLLSQKARKIPADRLAGWLLTTARYACANIRRTQMRREQREQVAAMNQDRPSDNDNRELLTLLDEALCRLPAKYREALILRYLKEQPLTEVGQTLGISEEAARKRVSRAMEKLRSYFSRHGLMTSAAALSAVMAEQTQASALTPAAHELIKQGALQAAHAGAASTAVGAVIAKGVNTAIFTTKLKIVAAIIAIAAAFLGSGWLISQVMTDKTPAPVAAAPVSAPPVPVPTPFPEVVLNLSTPEKTFDSMTRAMEAGDRANFYACITAEPNRPPTLIDAILDACFAQNRLIHAVNLVFGNGERSRQVGTPDRVMHIIMAGWSRSVPIAKIQGDTAVIPLNLPPMLVQMLPQQMHQDMEPWLGKTLLFMRMDNQWRADIDHLGRVEGSLEGPNLHTTDPNRLRAALFGEAKIIDQLADQILAHKFRTWQEASNNWDKEENKYRRTAGFRGLNFAFIPIPPAAGIPDLQGAWEGTMDLFGTGVAEGASTQTRIVLKLTNANGSYHATADFIDMGRKDIRVQKVTYDYPTIRLIVNPRTAYTLTINPDATEMLTSVTSFQGETREVVFKRTTSPDQVPPRLSESDFAPQSNSDLQGYWKGTIGQGDSALPVNLKIAQHSDGSFHGELDSPMLGSNNQPISILFSQPTLKLIVATGAGMFRGEFTGDSQITGSWIQGGQSKRAIFKRADYQAEHAHDADRDYSYTSTSDLQGHWKGSWNFIGTKIRLALDIAKLPDGTLSAALTNLDQFGNDDPIPASDFQSPPSSVHMAWKWAGGAFDGKLKYGKLTGAWKQGGGAFPLIFTRAPTN
jgi:RNA polymerase sigma factor (sigma-70 family)